MLRHDPDEMLGSNRAERLSTEEASFIARLHAEDLARQQAERERLAETTTPEDLAGMLGISADEVRRLSERARQMGTEAGESIEASPRFEPRADRKRLVRRLGATVGVIAVAWLTFSLGRSSVAPMAYPTARNLLPDAVATAETNVPVVIPISSPMVTPPPAGTSVRLAVGGRIFVATGPPGATRKLTPAERKTLAQAVRDLAALTRGPYDSLSAVRAFGGPLVRPLSDGSTEINAGFRRTVFPFGDSDVLAKRTEGLDRAIRNVNGER